METNNKTNNDDVKYTVSAQAEFVSEVKETKQKQTPKNSKPQTKSDKSNFSRKNNNKQRNSRTRTPKPKEFVEKLISVRRVTKVTKGGRRFSFSAFVIIGDNKGRVGLGKGKANEVPNAIQKAVAHAKRNLIVVPVTKSGTIPHTILAKFGASKVLIKPAPAGAGIIAGGPIRSVMELAGVRDVSCKSLGSSQAVNMTLATLRGLEKMRTAEQIRYYRGKLTPEELAARNNTTATEIPSEGK